jgi:hypothetical protein
LKQLELGNAALLGTHTQPEKKVMTPNLPSSSLPDSFSSSTSSSSSSSSSSTSVLPDVTPLIPAPSSTGQLSHTVIASEKNRFFTWNRPGVVMEQQGNQIPVYVPICDLKRVYSFLAQIEDEREPNPKKRQKREVVINDEESESHVTTEFGLENDGEEVLAKLSNCLNSSIS